MRSIVYDELRPEDLKKLDRHLGRTLKNSALGGVFWLELPPDILTAEQNGHAKSCGPHRVTLVLEEDSLRLELLVRSSESLRCSCTGYASKTQTRFLLDYMERLMEELEIKT